LCRYNNKIDTIRFYIRGTNPTETQIKDYLRQKSYLTQYWFIVKMTRQESSLCQFGSNGKYKTTKLTRTDQGKGESLYGPPRGFGLKQLDNWGPKENPKHATEQHLWDWKENIDGGVEVIIEKKAIANDIKAQNDEIINEWNKAHSHDQVSDNLYIDNGDETYTDTGTSTIKEGNITFAVSPTGDQKDINDANWIRKFNGGTYYKVIKRGKEKPIRVLYRTNSGGKNYVNDVCGRFD